MADLELTYSGSLANQKWVSLVDDTLNSNFPCALGSVAAGDVHTCVILDNDELKCFGRNEYGQLGYGDKEIDGMRNQGTVVLLERAEAAE